MISNLASASLISVRSVLRGWVNVDRVEMRMPDGVIVERHIEDHGDGAAVLPYDGERRVALLISQPRAPVLLGGGDPPVEVIAGRLDGKSAETCARQEAWEEGGIHLDVLEPVVHLWSMPSISTERLHLFLAPYSIAMRAGPGGGCASEHENISVHEVPLAQLASAASCGQITDAKTLILIFSLQIRYPEFFKE